MTLFGSIVGAIWPRNPPVGMPSPQEKWGASSHKYCLWNDGGFSTGVETLIDP